MEFTYGFTEDQKKRKAECARCSTPDRADKFIPIKEFDLQHLPKEHQFSKVLESFRSFADICVQIVVQHTSNHRPLGYPLYELGGDHELYRLGNGWITHLEDKFKSENTDTCPCKDCRSHADTAKGLWGEIYVGTAKHLVFNNKECEFTQCLCFYDTDDPSSPPPPRLQGVEVSNRDQFTYEIKCITHDYKLFLRLVIAHKRTNNLFTYQSKHTGPDNFYSVAISHVHGLGKQVSIIIEREVEIKKVIKENWTQLHYQGKHVYVAATCLGSSGAPVFVIGTREVEPVLQHFYRSFMGYKIYIHSLLNAVAHGKCVKDNVYESL